MNARRLTAVLVALLALVAACGALAPVAETPLGGSTASSYPMPVFMWSNTAYFTNGGASAQLLDSVPLSAVAGLVSSAVAGGIAASESPLSAQVYAGLVKKPDLTAVFLLPTLRLDTFAHRQAGSFSRLQTAVERAPTSLTLPYAQASCGSGSGASFGAQLAAQLAGDAADGVKATATCVVALTDAASATAEAEFAPLRQRCHSVRIVSTPVALAMLQDQQRSLFGNDVADLLLVQLPDATAAADSLVGDMVDAIEQRTGNALFVLTGDYAEQRAPLRQTVVSEAAAAAAAAELPIWLAAQSGNGSSSSSGGSPHPWESSIWEGLGAILVLFGTIFFGFGLVYNVKIPYKMYEWERDRPRDDVKKRQ